MSLTLLLLIGPAHVAHVAMRRPVVLRSVAVAMTEPVGTAEGAPVSPAPAVSEPAPKAAEAPKAAAAPAPQAMRPMPAQAVSRVPSKPTVPFGNGKRPRAEWDKPANYGRYSQMKQAYFSTLLPKTLRVPFVDFEIPVPTFKRPPLLDGTHAGDMGFDPLGLAKDVPTLQTYLEAELKHGRLAMLAVAGWVGAELLAESGLAPGGRAPSLLNGGLFRLQNFLCTGLIFALFSVLEEGREPKSSASTYKDGPGLYDWQHFLDGPYVPGCYNFDPLGLYGLIGADASGRKGMRELETAHGRFAMVAISVWAFLEPMTQKPVTQTFAFFFKPFWVVLGDIFNGLVSTGK